MLEEPLIWFGLEGACRQIIRIDSVHKQGCKSVENASRFPLRTEMFCALATHVDTNTRAGTHACMNTCLCVHISHRSQWKSTVERKEGKCQPYVSEKRW